MNRLKKLTAYLSLTFLILRGILWVSNLHLEQKADNLFLKGQNLRQQADSIRSLRVVSKDTIVISDLKRQEKELLANALDRQLMAKDYVNDHIKLLNNLSLVANSLGGVFLVFLIVLLIKELRRNG